MLDRDDRKMHLDEVLIEALNHGHVCKLSVAMRKNCLVMNFRMQTPCTPWTPKGCKFHRVVKGPVCPKFECEQGFFIRFANFHYRIRSNFRRPA